MIITTTIRSSKKKVDGVTSSEHNNMLQKFGIIMVMFLLLVLVSTGSLLALPSVAAAENVVHDYVPVCPTFCLYITKLWN